MIKYLLTVPEENSMFCGHLTADVSLGFALKKTLTVLGPQNILLYTECQSSFIPVSYWLRTYHVIVEKFYCLPGNVAKRWTLLLFTGK